MTGRITESELFVVKEYYYNHKSSNVRHSYYYLFPRWIYGPNHEKVFNYATYKYVCDLHPRILGKK